MPRLFFFNCVAYTKKGKHSSTCTDQKVKSFWIGAQIQPSSSSRFTRQETCYKCFLSVQSISAVYSNMQWFVSGYNSQLSDLHPLKISNNLSTTLTQLRLRHLLCCIHEETKTYADTDGSNSPEFLNWRADPAFFFVSFHPSRNLLQMSSFCLKYFSYIYSNMQWFLSGCNSQLSNLHPLKISNSLSTTLTQLRRQRRKADWVSISSVVKVDASTCLNITRSGSVFWRVREQQKTLQLSLLTKDFKSVK